MSNSNGDLQNLREFTVQIRHAITDVIVGTGFIVSNSGQVVTCAHVVRDASADRQVFRGVQMRVYFQPARQAYQAIVTGCFSEFEDDVVLLQLLGNVQSLLPKQMSVAVLDSADQSSHHRFRSYGYRRLDAYIAGIAEGEILGDVEGPRERNLQVEPVQLRSSQINAGMSGAAVLDLDTNRVVGIVSETWFPDISTKDRDTAWAVNARILTFEPMSLVMQNASSLDRNKPQHQHNIDPLRREAMPNQQIELNSAPPQVAEWVGREDLLNALEADWVDPQRHVTALIGFGGEGKSSLARRWLDNLLAEPSAPKPTEVFWWSFYEKSSIDEFFEASLTFMSGGLIDPRQLSSASMQAQVIRSMLGTGRYLFVLDGLEVLQHQDGDNYGLLRSLDIREFLRRFAAGEHQSFCLITSRVPVLDLIDHTTYTHRDVERLIPHEGRTLLQKIGVTGADAELDQMVQNWDGHALVLSLLGSYLVDHHSGEVEHLKDIPAPAAKESRYERVSRVLSRYNEHLTEDEREFMKVFSAFRLPVLKSSLGPVFLVDEVVTRHLVAYRILRNDPQEQCYNTHPLIRNYYLEHLNLNTTKAQAVHKHIGDYYLSISRGIPDKPTLEDLILLIEAVHHLCQAGAYDEAFRIWRGHIEQGSRKVLIYELSAYETALTLMLEFFDDGDISLEPQLQNPDEKRLILNEVGFCLMNLGHLSEAAPLYQRSNAISLVRRDWYNASIGCNNLAILYAHLGKFPDSADAALEAVSLARRAQNVQAEGNALARQAWIAHLQGDLETAGRIFQQVEALQQKIDPTIRYRYSKDGIWHADHLRRLGDADYARHITEANLKISEDRRWPDDISRCHRVFGDLDSMTGQHDTANQHYDKALEIARSISFRPVLIEALSARGRWAAQQGEVDLAYIDLDEALGYAVASKDLVYEVDIRVGLAWMYVAKRNPLRTRLEVDRIKQLSLEIGYYWGWLEAAEVFAALGGSAIQISEF